MENQHVQTITIIIFRVGLGNSCSIAFIIITFTLLSSSHHPLPLSFLTIPPPFSLPFFSPLASPPDPQKVISIHAIRDISCCATDIEDKRVFAYISKDRATGNNYSHVFLADSEVGVANIT